MAPRWQAGPGRSFTPFFRVIRNTKTVRGAEQMIRYVAFRSKDLEGKQKGAFCPDTDHADVREFVRDLPDRLTRHPKAPKAFHCLLSLSREEYDRCGLTDWREVTREVMRTYEQETGRKLTWIASQHDNPTHPHCHVIVKAVYEDQDGRRRKLRLTREDLRQFRKVTGRVLAYHRAQARALERAGGIRAQRALAMGDSFMRSLWQMLDQERRRRERESDRAHQRWLRGDDERER
ncbi:MAG: relaxase/mobilization nuclease domain-containing protein [Bacillota bacterium]